MSYPIYEIAAQGVAELEKLFIATSHEEAIHPFHVEKDFWVCWVLTVLFDAKELQGCLSFRGGTSLAKGWQVIDRFSEDIDLAIDRTYLGAVAANLNPTAGGKLSSGQESRFRKECRTFIREKIVPALERNAEPLGGKIDIGGLDSDRDPFVVFFHYPKINTNAFQFPDYFRPVVKIELSGRADTRPSEKKEISSFVEEKLRTAVSFGGTSAQVPCVLPLRTFWEKLALIHERLLRDTENFPERLSRHLYDIHKLWTKRAGKIDTAIFRDVMQNRAYFFNYRWVDHTSLTIDELKIVPAGAHLGRWKADFVKMESMFRSTPPSFEEVLETLNEVQDTLRNIER